MPMTARGWLLLALVLPALAWAPVGDGRNCTKGKPCGNTCIAANKTCRIGGGTATRSPAAARSYVPPATSYPARPATAAAAAAALRTQGRPAGAGLRPDAPGARGVPDFDVRAYCDQVAQRLQIPGLEWVYRCVDRELAAQQELSELSGLVGAGRLDSCAGSIGAHPGAGTYQGMLVCVGATATGRAGAR